MTPEDAWKEYIALSQELESLMTKDHDLPAEYAQGWDDALKYMIRKLNTRVQKLLRKKQS